MYRYNLHKKLGNIVNTLHYLYSADPALQPLLEYKDIFSVLLSEGLLTDPLRFGPPSTVYLGMP